MKKIFTELSVLACFCLLLLSSVAFAQNITVKGIVKDDQNLPVPSASVMIKGTNNGVQTDANGNYSISAPNNSTLVFSFIGFANQELPVNNRTTINVTLLPATNDLQQVVVVGYGTQQKKDLTGSIASVKGDEIEKMAVTNPMNALQGKVPGLTISTSGTPGSGGTVRIRGIASTNNANPLYVVDGVFQDNIDYLNPADIETIDVLKDASSTAIYGLRGANGVIAITTKRAAKGKSTINFSSTVGIQQVEQLIDVTDADGFKKLFSGTLAATGATFDYTNYTGNTNWQKEILRDAYINTNSLSISNTGEKSTTLINLGYNDQDGVVKYSNFKKFVARLSQETKLNDAIKIGGDITGYHYRNNPNNVGLNAGVWAAPIVDARSQNGLYNAMPSFQQSSVGNPAYTIERLRNTSINRGYRATGSLFGEIKFLKDFTWRSTVYTDLRFNSIRAYTPLPFPIVYLGESQINSVTRTFVDPNARTTVRQEAFERRLFQQDHTLTFNKTIKQDHKVNAVAGFTTVNISNTNLVGSRTDSTLAVPNDPNLWYINIINADNITTNSGTGDLESNVGFFGRASYSFKNKYLLNATVRRDGSSKFAPQNRWGTFGSVGLGWIASEEDFFKNNIKGIDFLKFRAAWGRLGNSNAIPNNVYQQTLNTSSSAVFGEFTYPAITYSYRPDPNLHWEVIQGFDVGVDVRAFNNKLSAELNYYDKQTLDLFTRVRLPDDPTRDYYTNLGKVTNKGTEIALGWNDKLGEITYNVAGNFSYVKNKVVSIGNASNFQLPGNGNINLTETGKSIGYFYGFRQVGIYQSTADLDRMPRMLTSLPGDIAYEDLNGDGVITAADRTYLGTPFPPYSYGLSVSLGYKGFDFSIDGQGVAGNKIYTQWKTASFAQLNYPSNRLNAWTAPGTSNVEPIIVPRSNNQLFSTYFLEDGSYFRLRNILIGYTFPKTMLAKVGVQKLRIYASGQNVKTWSKVSGYTPEAQLGDILGSGADNGVYPVPSIYSFGLNLTF